MNKKSLASLELAALVNELQFLVNGKISQIYHQEEKELLFQLHAVSKGKCLLKIIPGKYLCLSRKKETPLRPSGFCMQLRKYLSNTILMKIEQKDAERVVIFELQKGGKENYAKYYLILEFFSKGNLILADKDFQIITVLERQIWKDRTIKPGETYTIPKLGVNWKKITEKELTTIFKKSEKNNLAIALAAEVGLGGLYAEEVCKLNQIDKKKLPQDVDEEEIKLILKTIKNFVELIKQPQGFIYAEQITPFELFGEKVNKKTSSYNEAMDTLNPFRIISPYEKKIKTIERMVEQQEGSVRKQKKVIELNTQKGELVYERYAPLQKLLGIVKELRKTKEWSEIESELKKEKKIKKIDLKKKKIILEL